MKSMDNTGLQVRWLPVGVLALACSYLVLLLSTVQPQVFFSGDGGLKWLVVQQRGGYSGYTTLKLPADSAETGIWNQGYYPFKPPFVYDRRNEKTVSFPPFFQQLSAPLFHIFGYRGLYIIPAVSLLLLWSWFCWLLLRLHVKSSMASLAVFCLACCSPLTLYGAVFWEHTMACLLLFSGVVFLLMPTRRRVPAALLGCMTALAAWLRPEALLLCLLFVSAVVYNQREEGNRGNKYFVAGLLATVMLFFLYNRMVYGDFLGAHGYQLLGEASTIRKIQSSLVLLLHLNAKQFIYFPLSVPAFVWIIYAFIKRNYIRREVWQLLLIAILFSLVAPFFLPNAGGKQWAPRYFLFLIPIVLFAASLQLSSVLKTASWLRWSILPLIIYSIYLNTFTACNTLHDDYAYRVKPCLDAVRHDACKSVVVQNQFIAQEFAALFLTKKIFLAEDATQFARLKPLLQKAGINEIIFIAKDRQHLVPLQTSENNTRGFQHVGDYYLTYCKWQH